MSSEVNLPPSSNPSELEQMTLEELRQSVHFSSNRLLQLTYSEEKYLKTIVDLNQNAIQHIEHDELDEALVYLAEAERVLEYGASCGKSIDRNLIITVLHNQACCFYRDRDLHKASSYLEGIIFNLKSFSASIDTSPATSSFLTERNRRKQEQDFYGVAVEKKVELIHYYLRYCTINSQAKNRDCALQAGKSVVRLAKLLFTDLVFDNPKIKNSADSSLQQSASEVGAKQSFKDILKSQVFFREEIWPQRVEEYKKLARVYVRKWNEKKMNSEQKLSPTLQKYVSNYSISEVIEVFPVQYNPNSEWLYDSLMNAKSIMRQLLHCSMGYFTISTEFRLLAEYRYPHSFQEKTASEEWRSANIYHLMAITFIGVNIGCDLLFMTQLISSYEQHYKTSIFVEEQLPEAELHSLSMDLLFEEPRQSREQSKLVKHSSSLVEKMKKLKSKEKRSVSGHSKSSGKFREYKNKIDKNSITKNPSHNISKSSLSSKQQSERISANTSTIFANSSKILNDTKLNGKTRKRSQSKDSASHNQAGTIHLNVQIFNNNKIQRARNEYQMGPQIKSQNKIAVRRRRSSSSSEKPLNSPAVLVSVKEKTLSKAKLHHKAANLKNNQGQVKVLRVKSPPLPGKPEGKVIKIKDSEEGFRKQQKLKSNTGKSHKPQREFSKRKRTNSQQKQYIS